MTNVPFHDWWVALIDQRALSRAAAMVHGRWRRAAGRPRPPPADPDLPGAAPTAASGGAGAPSSQALANAIDLLYSHGDWIWRYLHNVRVPSRDLPDAVHDVMVRAIQGIATYDAAKGSVRGWLMGIAHNVAREHRRKRANSWLPPGDSDSAPRGAATSVQARQEALVDAELLQKVLAKLSDGDVEVLVLHDALDFSVLEIAREFEESESAIRSRLARARRRFEEEASRLEGKEGELP